MPRPERWRRGRRLENSNVSLLPGYFVRVRIPVTPRPGLLMPDAALGSDQSGRYVLGGQQGHVVEQRNVELGQLAEICA